MRHTSIAHFRYTLYFQHEQSSAGGDMFTLNKLVGAYLVLVGVAVAAFFIINTLLVDAIDVLTIWYALDVLMVIGLGLGLALAFNYQRKRGECPARTRARAFTFQAAVTNKAKLLRSIK